MEGCFLTDDGGVFLTGDGRVFLIDDGGVFFNGQWSGCFIT